VADVGSKRQWPHNPSPSLQSYDEGFVEGSEAERVAVLRYLREWARTTAPAAFIPHVLNLANGIAAGEHVR